MRRKFATLALAATLMAPLALAQPAAGPPAKAAKAAYKAPRNAFGQPDFEGVWNTSYVLPLEARADAPNLIIPEAESRALARKIANDVDKLEIFRLDPEVAGMQKMSAENGMGLVRGERRTRQVVLPADGKLPYTPRGRAEAAGIDGQVANGIPTLVANNPEDRPSWERCTNMQGQPPITVTTDVNPRQFFQNRDQIMIRTEYSNEVRIIPFTDKHGPAVMRPPMGDSIARWEGETLVIETIRLPEKDRFRVFPTLIVPSTSTVIEKYTRVAPNELLYQYTVIDPTVYTRPWLAEFSLYKTTTPIYEFACHEGNYSLPNILGGAREAERLAREKAAAARR